MDIIYKENKKSIVFGFVYIFQDLRNVKFVPLHNSVTATFGNSRHKGGIYGLEDLSAGSYLTEVEQSGHQSMASSFGPKAANLCNQCKV